MIQTQRVLSPTQIPLADYTINPYRGCEFGCLYCYARENKNVRNSVECLGVKMNAPSVLEKELRYKSPRRVLLGSTTECFQYKEPEYKITEKILKLLNSHNIPYTILTKSHLIANYLPIIKENKNNKIYFTFNFSSDRIIKVFEEKTPNIKERIKAIKEIIACKIPMRLHLGPFIPYLSSLEEIISLMPDSIREADIELYHHSMGNFTDILNVAEENFGKELRHRIENVYKSERNYLEFAKKLKGTISKTKTPGETKFFYIVPDFGNYYNTNIGYKDSTWNTESQ